MCATSWCNLDLTLDLAHLMLFYISNTLLSLLYLSYIFYLVVGCWLLVVAPLGDFWCRLGTVKVILKFINCFICATSHCNSWYCI